ncbi:hypothetical protein FVE85_9618 [Porphyridium purpureum]|uniref:Uncharacterized protein n=1 Tax=Porphyridium purpureum TaxID=35688 RepID=A0A5J4YH38_PORPP|nr:hypothetical protein FVE85_9618 [Porphyridium purpureum]|eukprot:POR1379..scf267_23
MSLATVEGSGVAEWRRDRDAYKDVLAAHAKAGGTRAARLVALEHALFEFDESQVPRFEVSKAHLLDLVEYKHARGKFRPNKHLVERNAEAQVLEVTRRALSSLVGVENPSLATLLHAVDTVCELSGVGPFTASLVVARACPAHAAFGSDEAIRFAFAKKHSTAAPYKPKYNMTELREVWQRLKVLQTHLQSKDGAKTWPLRDVERAIFVRERAGMLPPAAEQTAPVKRPHDSQSGTALSEQSTKRKRPRSHG